jgi:hypothetical protein
MRGMKLARCSARVLKPPTPMDQSRRPHFLGTQNTERKAQTRLFELHPSRIILPIQNYGSVCVTQKRVRPMKASSKSSKCAPTRAPLPIPMQVTNRRKKRRSNVTSPGPKRKGWKTIHSKKEIQDMDGHREHQLAEVNTSAANERERSKQVRHENPPNHPRHGGGRTPSTPSGTSVVATEDKRTENRTRQKRNAGKARCLLSKSQHRHAK